MCYCRKWWGMTSTYLSTQYFLWNLWQNSTDSQFFVTKRCTQNTADLAVEMIWFVLVDGAGQPQRAQGRLSSPRLLIASYIGPRLITQFSSQPCILVIFTKAVVPQLLLDHLSPRWTESIHRETTIHPEKFSVVMHSKETTTIWGWSP